MELQRQGYQECWITSLAMVTGQTLDTVRAEFEQTANTGPLRIPYRGIIETMKDRWFVTSVLMMDKYKLRASYGSKLNTISMGSPTSTGRVNLTAKQLHGKGLLCVCFGKHNAHAVAFEDGMIYDPEMTTPVSLITWRKIKRQIKSWRIDRMGA